MRFANEDAKMRHKNNAILVNFYDHKGDMITGMEINVAARKSQIHDAFQAATIALSEPLARKVYNLRAYLVPAPVRKW